MEHLTAFLIFAISSSITPGPNNIMLMTSGVNFGVKRSIPHLMGVVIGFPLFLLICGFGLATVFTTSTLLHEIVKYVGATYMLFLAWKIATMKPHFEDSSKKEPISFLQALIFQWVNPKAWVMGIGAIAAFTSVEGNLYVEIITIALIYLFIVLVCGSCWMVFGAGLKRYLKKASHFTVFNVSMGVLLALSVALIFIE